MNFIAYSQTKEDFQLKTVLEDTLLKGFPNFIQIETNLDLSKVNLVGDGIHLAKVDNKGKYEAKVSAAKKYGTIHLDYQSSNDSLIRHDFHFVFVSTNPEFINRYRKIMDLAPMLTQEFIDEKKVKEIEKLKLIIPDFAPEMYNPILLSQNKKLAFLGNLESRKSSILDLKSRKIVSVDEKDSIIFPTYEGCLSNTGRYLYPGYLESTNDGSILYKDLIDQKYMKFLENSTEVEDFNGKPSLFNEYYSFNFIDFSPQDHSCFAIVAKNGIEYILTTELKEVEFKEYKINGDFINAAAYSNDKTIECLSTSDYNYIIDSAQYIFYLNSIDITTRETKLIDSLILNSYPFKTSIEHGILSLGFFNSIDNSFTYQFYNSANLNLLNEITLPKEYNYSNYNKKEKHVLNHALFPRLSINPEATHATFNQIIDKEIVVYHFNLFTKELKKSINLYTSSESYSMSLLVENEVIFGQWEEKKIYLDQQLISPYWIDLKTKTSQIYSPPILQKVDYGFAMSSSNFCTNIDQLKGDFELQSFEKTKRKDKFHTTIHFDELEKNNLRFGTKISGNYAVSDRHSGFYDFDLSNLKLKPIYQITSYVTDLRGSLYELNQANCNFPNLPQIDSIYEIDPSRDMSLLSVYDSTKLIFGNQETNEIVFFNLNKKESIERQVNLKILKTNDWIMTCNDNFYACNFKNEAPFQFSISGKAYPFEQFDLKYNRPDIILDRLGYATDETVQLYYNAYLKRLQKMGFTEEMLKPDFHLPILILKNKDEIKSSTLESNLQLQISCIDTKYKLDRVNIWINDVPIYGIGGINLRLKNIFEYKDSINITLIEGANKIQLSILNQAGAESLKETIFVDYVPIKKSLPNLFIATLGVSEYNDSSYNLTYAAKDAQDIQKMFLNADKRLFQSVKVKSLLNDQVTKENILNLKEFFKDAKREDVVVISYAGHGVLDDQFNYFLANFDIDFNSPSKNGVLYDDLESLLDSILPLKKVLFIDACHSGEIEMDAINVNQNNGVMAKQVGRGGKAEYTGDQNKINTYDLTKEIFSDLRRGTGATVVSASGGMEFAMESAEWQNGLFTYSLLHGLKDKIADSNNDGQIMLSELQQFLQKEVFILSNGLQKPTSRIENISMDFRIW